MKLPAFILGLLMPLSVLGANTPTGLSSPILTNFWPRDFDINIARPNTELIKLNLNSQQFDNGGSTITITNLGNVTGGTNIFNTVYVTNITYTSNLFVTNITANTTYTSNLFVTNITANTIITTNIFVTNVFNTFLVTSNIVAGNVQGTPPHLSYFWPDNFSLTDSIVTQNTNDNNGITINGTGNAEIDLGGINMEKIVFGTGATNVFYRTNEFLAFTNSAAGNDPSGYQAINSSGTIGNFGVAGNVTRIWPSGTGNAIDLVDVNNKTLRWWNNTLTPTQDSTELGHNGGGQFPWGSFKLQGTAYVYGYNPDVSDSANYSRLSVTHTGVSGYVLFSSQALGTGGTPRPSVFDRNIGALMTAGDTDFVDMFQPTQTNQLSGALTFAHATNGLNLVEFTHRRYFFNPSGANRLITLPSGWHNISGASFTVTNSTMARLDVTSWGDTSSSALQTNVSSMVTFMP